MNFVPLCQNSILNFVLLKLCCHNYTANLESHLTFLSFSTLQFNNKINEECDLKEIKLRKSYL